MTREAYERLLSYLNWATIITLGKAIKTPVIGLYYLIRRFYRRILSNIAAYA